MNRKSLLQLETIFSYNLNRDSISVIRKVVENYERLVKEQAERIESAKLNKSKE
ncbi:MAG: hypothetical protein Q8N05_21505 [Bacteroidota bacterium]|nr:hypothetical protein [Bacteroidota bacterium]